MRFETCSARYRPSRPEHVRVQTFTIKPRDTRETVITGTDAGVGKTTLEAPLCAALDAVYWKPIQTGTLEGSDRVTVMRLAGIGTDRTLDEVYKFVPPVSPDLAARWAGVEIDLGRINMPTSLLNDWLVIEGLAACWSQSIKNSSCWI